MGPSFPLELVRNSLQFLQPIGSYRDAEALRSCALVCRTWTSLSQSKLFYALSISEDDFYLLSKLVKHSPHLGQFVHELHIEGNFTFDFSTRISRVPAEVSSLLPHLSTLKYGGIIRHFVSRLGGSFTSLRYISLEYTDAVFRLHDIGREIIKFFVGRLLSNYSTIESVTLVIPLDAMTFSDSTSLHWGTFN
jgi:hypothetical protein